MYTTDTYPEPASPAHPHRFGGNPFFVLGSRPFREARLRSYIVGQHRRGRALTDIAGDAYVRRCGNARLFWRVVQDPRTVEALERDIRDAFEQARGSVTAGSARA